MQPITIIRNELVQNVTGSSNGSLGWLTLSQATHKLYISYSLRKDTQRMLNIIMMKQLTFNVHRKTAT